MSNPIKVTFFTPFKELQETMPPVPASKFWPQWFKDAPGTRPGTEGYHKDSRTVKSCPVTPTAAPVTNGIFFSMQALFKE